MRRGRTERVFTGMESLRPDHPSHGLYRHWWIIETARRGERAGVGWPDHTYAAALAAVAGNGLLPSTRLCHRTDTRVPED